MEEKPHTSVAVFDSGNLVVKAGVVAANDGLDQVVVSLAQGGAAGVVHGVVVAKGGADVGKVYRGDDEHFFVGGGVLQGVDTAVSTTHLAPDAPHSSQNGERSRTKSAPSVWDRRQLDGKGNAAKRPKVQSNVPAMVQLFGKGSFFADGGGQFIDQLRVRGQDAVRGGVRLAGQGKGAQTAVVVGAKNNDEIGFENGRFRPLPHL